MAFEDFLENNPCIRIVIPFIIGIIIGDQLSIPIYLSISVFGIAIIIAIYLYNKLLQYTQRWLPGFFTCIAMLTLGTLLVTINKTQPTEESASKLSNKYRAVVLTPPAQKGKFFKTDLQIEAAMIADSWYNIDTKINALIESDSAAGKLKAGQTIEFAAQIDSLNGPKNPFGFDYSNYLKTNGIHGSIFLNSGKWQIVNTEVRGIRQRALNIRQHLIELFE